MNHYEAREVVSAGRVSFALLRSLLNVEASAEPSTACSMFSKAQVREMISAAIDSKKGRIDPETVWALFAIWCLVEFSEG